MSRSVFAVSALARGPLPVALLSLLAACGPPIGEQQGLGPELEPNVDSENETASNLEDEFAAAAAEWDVPASLLKAVAYENSQWQDGRGCGRV